MKLCDKCLVGKSLENPIHLLLVCPHPGTFLCHPPHCNAELTPGRGIQEGDKPHCGSAPLPLLCLRVELNPSQLPAPPQPPEASQAAAGTGGIQAGFVPVWDSEPRGEWGWGVPAQGDREAGWEGDRGPASLRAPVGRQPIPNGCASQEWSLLLPTLHPRVGDALWDQGADTHPWETARSSGNMRKFLVFSFFLPLSHCSRFKQIFCTAHRCLLRPRNLQAKSH